MDIILRPIISEKMTAQTEKMNRYGFIVERTADKIQIAKAIEELYNVKVASVNTIRYGGKLKSRYTKAGFVQGKTNNYKKAIITLAVGETIDFYSNI
ncbi:MAG TPA: 50S ribosomal protein L23 [Marinilabiliales bacterium]|jgi:large subunit ribosomal protein L23|nr:50S ribosomal protein L23 [Salinivirgaceae bacterium]OFX37502.1 MAG: 50S ribosomal protein L23 [Bacteroidetes bacterium GWA2_40_14]OFX62633.1 MAG: 50S ribosomal protein L23 [Bacteroidetes bacterium GWC2_40_13]OFX74371.1 MAG: 50S ribosomal protein L23 [Bacteroidetes bacterium GWD2_40_43]OFX95216.1 MAG: 50S ribosomal protein L23 [Bacteroidetes bacterium GWE2_40_63]OFY21108.1 MAG: 50S ribosomal protein L23 [Bacteroidetes bacterium GWF2_40_13]OFZ30882.1 MAG: 50S ribosomal protein L23 [Bacteroi